MVELKLDSAWLALIGKLPSFSHQTRYWFLCHLQLSSPLPMWNVPEFERLRSSALNGDYCSPAGTSRLFCNDGAACMITKLLKAVAVKAVEADLFKTY